MLTVNLKKQVEHFVDNFLVDVDAEISNQTKELKNQNELLKKTIDLLTEKKHEYRGNPIPKQQHEPGSTQTCFGTISHETSSTQTEQHKIKQLEEENKTLRDISTSYAITSLEQIKSIYELKDRISVLYADRDKSSLSQQKTINEISAAHNKIILTQQNIIDELKNKLLNTAEKDAEIKTLKKSIFTQRSLNIKMIEEKKSIKESFDKMEQALINEKLKNEKLRIENKRLLDIISGLDDDSDLPY